MYAPLSSRKAIAARVPRRPARPLRVAIVAAAAALARATRRRRAGGEADGADAEQPLLGVGQLEAGLEGVIE